MLITFEGGEGCGKSTQITLFKDYLTRKGVDAFFSREPGGCELSEKIRELLQYSTKTMCPQAELLLYSAARAELTNTILKPKLEKGALVVLDRFFDSTLAYQGVARGFGFETVLSATQLAIGDLVPDLTFYFKISPADAFARKGGVDISDRIEREGMEFHQKVAEGYDRIAEEFPERVVVVDARRSAEEIHADVVKEFEKRYKPKR